ncbi:hypothetical protein A3860_03790 [Niastella vici]|uniref:Sulfotransferase family protein n=1 Tax=Niastella vici TaxID=1703345 RepID=A0A1V9FXZ2_9BACT|nr:hypothetical protein [Niastella vici]OQP63106.1 hypothetical protein A3860_03790 [Niastella vici]
MEARISSALANWIPYKLSFAEGEPYCEWLYTGDEDFTEPFFDDTIAKCLQYNNRGHKSISSLDVLPQWSNEIESIPPSAFIFHVSRCGSTLASQLLALDSGNIVLSEVPFFDALLRANKNIPQQLLKAAVAFYASVKNNRKRLFIKTDSWHIFFYKQLRELYPLTPFILLYRRPDEVMRSQQKRSGMHAIPGLIEPALLGFAENEVQYMDQNEYLGRLLDKYFQAFEHILEEDPLAIPVNYNEGPIAMVEKIAAITGTPVGFGEMERIKDRARYHAKYPAQVFAEAAIRDPVPAYCRAAYERYEALERSRNS